MKFKKCLNNTYVPLILEYFSKVVFIINYIWQQLGHLQGVKWTQGIPEEIHEDLKLMSLNPLMPQVVKRPAMWLAELYKGS